MNLRLALGVFKVAVKRWRKWTLPTRLALSMGVISVFGVLIGAAAWYRPDFWKRALSDNQTPTGSRWRDTPQGESLTFVSFDVPDAVDTHPTAINENDEIAGIYSKDSGQFGFLRKPDGTVDSFEYPGTHSVTSVTGINNHSEIVGFYYGSGTGPYGSPAHSFLRQTNGAFISFDYPSATYTFAQAINDKREIVGSYLDSNGISHAFLRSTDGSYTSVDRPGAASTVAAGINNQGEIVGNWRDLKFGDRGFLMMNNRVFVPIEPDPTTSSYPTGINDQATIVGHTSLGGFLRSPGGSLSPLEHPACFGNPCTIPTGINNREQIVGQFQASNRVHGFLATPQRPDATALGADSVTR